MALEKRVLTLVPKKKNKKKTHNDTTSFLLSKRQLLSRKIDLQFEEYDRRSEKKAPFYPEYHLLDFGSYFMADIDIVRNLDQKELKTPECTCALCL